LKVYRNIQEFTKLENAIVTTGTFDGVHQGHKKIIDRLKFLAQIYQGETVLLTFSPHPRLVLFPDNKDLKLITSENEKIEILNGLGIDHLIIHPFTKEFSRLSSIEFVRNILVNQIGTKKLVIGYNHHFGRNREGTFEHLKEFGPIYGFDVEEISAHDVQSINVSSTKIRNAIQHGDIKTANSYLGYRFLLSGHVVHGLSNGRKIGYPTANIRVSESTKMIPLEGVYAVEVEKDGVLYGGMLNIGNKPTFGTFNQTIEVHIFDFNQDLYGQEIKVFFKDRIRDEIKFDSVDDLKNQLAKDKIIAASI